MDLLYRLAYWLVATRAFLWLSAAPFRVARALAGESFALRALGKTTGYFRRLLWRWPHGTPGHRNMDFARFLRRLERRVKRLANVPKRPPRQRRHETPRVGCIGALSVLYNYHTRLFEAFPQREKLHFFDTRYKKRGVAPARYLERLGAEYTFFDLLADPEDPQAPREKLQRAAAAINHANLDLLLVLFNVTEMYDLLTYLDCRCIAEVCMISDLLHHPKVDFHLFPQPAADYFPVDNHIFSSLSRSRFGDQLVYPSSLFFDPRGIMMDRGPSWAEREPLMFFHGLLYKLASPPLLELLFDLMRSDDDLQLVFMGQDIGKGREKGASLGLIQELAARRGVAGRVHYEGHFSATRSADGIVPDAGWQRCQDYLKRARLAPDPWPAGGGSARFEAYCAGAPSVHMGVRFDEASWGRPRLAIVELPNLRVDIATATSAAGYREICQRCLYDGKFADRLVGEQLQTAKRASDAPAWWRETLGFYEDWLRRVAERS